MKIRMREVLLWVCGALLASAAARAADEELILPAELPVHQTFVSIVGDEFYLNGRPTYEGRHWKGHKIQGLLLNARLVQGLFDDRNTNTVQRWAYPDTGGWDPERNTREFLAAMPLWRQRGLLAFTINLQGGSPEGYSREQPWHNSGIEADGSLRADYLDRLERILDKADDLGMAVILGYFYFGQDHRLADEAAVIRATDNITKWVLDHGYRHVLAEVNNECNVNYDHAILQPARVHELINRVRNTMHNHRRLYVGTSYGGGAIPQENVVRASDFLLVHGNGVSDPARLAEMVRKARAVPGFFSKPVLFNEDDHFEFDKATNNFVAAIGEYASWGYFDPGTNNYSDGYQSPPVNWGLNTARKAGFFRLLAEITGAEVPANAPTAIAPMPTMPAIIAPAAPERASRITYHGWTNAHRLSNGAAEVIIVPDIGRVVQFGLTGEEGVFWENRKLDGRLPDWNSSEWANFGGDKTWPAPDTDWSKYTQRAGWRPPPAFDAMPVTAQIEADGDVTLTSPIDPFYHVRVQRRVHLDAVRPVMTIYTTYERVSGARLQVGVWVITQLAEPAGLFAPVPRNTKGAGYTLLSNEHPPDVRVKKGLLSLTRNPKAAHKIGCEAGSLVWVGPRCALRIDSQRVPGAQYPDQGSSAAIYTNPDPLPYVELEILGPLQMLKAGDRLQQVSTYTLSRRTEAKPESEARRMLGL
jgi:hypothetical protein